MVMSYVNFICKLNVFFPLCVLRIRSMKMILLTSFCRQEVRCNNCLFFCLFFIYSAIWWRHVKLLIFLCFSLQKCQPPSNQHQNLLWTVWIQTPLPLPLLPPLSSCCCPPPSHPAATPRSRPPQCSLSFRLWPTPRKRDSTSVPLGVDAWRTFSKAPPVSLCWGWSPVACWLWLMTSTVKCCALPASWTIPCLLWILSTWQRRGSKAWTVWIGWISPWGERGERKPPRWPHWAPKHPLVSFLRTSWTVMTCRYTGIPVYSRKLSENKHPMRGSVARTDTVTHMHKNKLIAEASVSD